MTTTFDYKMKAVCIDNDSDIYIVDNMNKDLFFAFGVVCLSDYRSGNESYIPIGEIKNEDVSNEIHKVLWEGFVKREFSERNKRHHLFNVNLITNKLMSEFNKYNKGKRIQQQQELIDEVCKFLGLEIFKVNENQRIVIRELEKGDALPLDAIYINLTGFYKGNSMKISHKLPLITNYNVLCGDTIYMKGLPTIKFHQTDMSYVLDKDTGEQAITYNPIVKEDELIIKYPKLEKAVCFPIDYVHELFSNAPTLNSYPNGEAVICPVKVEKHGETKRQLAMIRIRVNASAFETAIQDFKYILENSKHSEIMSLTCLHSVQLFSTSVDLIEWLEKNWSLCMLPLEMIETLRVRIYTEEADTMYASSRAHYTRNEETSLYKYITEPLTVLQEMIKVLYTEWCD